MKHQSFMISVISFLFALSSAFAGTWTGGGGDNKWSNPNNWKGATVPGDGEQLTINCGGSIEIEIGPGEEVFVGQVQVGSGNPTSVRFYGGGKMTRLADTSTDATFIYSGSEIVVDGIEWNTKKCGFSIRADATLEMRSGLCYNGEGGDGAAFMYDGSKLVVNGGLFRIQRFSRSAQARLIVNGGTLDYRTDNGASGETTGITFNGGTLMVPPNMVRDEARLPTGDGSKLVARNPTTSVNAFAADGSYMLRGTIEGTNNWSAASLYPYLYITNSVNVGGRGKWFLGSLYENGGKTTRARLDLAELIFGYLNKGNAGSILEYYNGLTLRPMGCNQNYDGVQAYWHGLLNADTTDYMDPAVGRRINFSDFYPQTTVGLKAFASGAGKGEVFVHFPNLDALNKRHYDRFEVKDGALLRLESGDLANVIVRVGTIDVGAGSTLSITGANLRVVAETRAATIDPTATVEYRTTTTYGAGSRVGILDMGPYGDVSDVNIVTPNGLPAGWRIAKDGPIAYLTDDSPIADPDNVNATVWTWVGTNSCNWSDGKNWAICKNNTDHTKYPGKNQTVTFVGLGSTIISNDVDSLSVAKILVKNGSAVVRLRGKPISLTQTAVSGSSMPIQMDSKNRTATIFENKIVSSSPSFFAPGSTCAYLAYLGGLDVPNAVFNIHGESRFGGTSEIFSSQIIGDRASDGVTGNNPSISLITNAVVTIFSQTNDWTYSGTFSLRVDEGAKLRFTNPGNRTDVKYRPTFAFYNTTIHGLMNIGIPFYVVGDQRFYGRGAIALGCVRGDATGSGRICIGDGLTLYSTGFDTVSAENPDSAVSVLAESDATIGATCDWTYGPAAGVTTATTAADRALRSAGVYATLTIDTEDPETGVGHKITFADPIRAAGDLIKKGAGTLVFETTGNTVAERFTVEAGTLALGPTLGANMDWTSVLTAKEFVGLDACKVDGFKMRVVVNGDGTASLQMKPKSGIMLIVR